MTATPVSEAIATLPRARRRGPIRLPNGWTWLTVPALLFMVLVFVVPLVYVVVQSLTSPSPANFSEAVTDPLFLRSLGVTFEMAIVVTVLCVVVSYPFAYVMARSGPVLRAVLSASVLISFWTSFLVRTFSWQVLLSNSGLVNDLLVGLHIVEQPIGMLHTSFAVDLAMVHILAPLSILGLYNQLRTISPSLEQAARSMGARPASAFWRITVPLSMPAAFASAVLVFVTSLGYYITAQILGDSGKIYTGQVIVLEVQRFYQPGEGAAMSILLLAAVLVILLVAGRLVGFNRLLGVGAAAGVDR